MFSRTTIASSINSPMHNDKAMSVTMLMVKPSKAMAKKVPMTAMGKVSPVITVERHELRNRNTMATVSKAPSTRVLRTLATDTRIGRELSPIGTKRTPAGTSAANS